jgi:hypothetical protein
MIQDVYKPIVSMIGQSFKRVFVNGEGWPTFVLEDGEDDDSDANCFTLDHRQDCCESVYLAETVGDLGDLAGSPLLQAEVATRDVQDDLDVDYRERWTFYKFATAKGYVTLRFIGSDNGYYSVGVDIRYRGKCIQPSSAFTELQQ